MGDELRSEGESRPNKYMVGPGIGMVIMGILYIWWWVMPWAWEAYFEDQRWGHNWAYAIIIFTVGLAWYQKSPVPRMVAVLQSLMMPITAVGAFNTTIAAIVCIIIFIIWVVLVIIERKTEKLLLADKMQKRTVNWLNMHTMIIAWILVGHMGLVFFLARAPFEIQLLNIEGMYGVRPGFLMYLPPETHEYATWSYDIALTIWMCLICYEQFKMGYNFKNKPWPKWSFLWTIVGLIMIPLVALAIQFA
jgi:hypothetical protein